MRTVALDDKYALQDGDAYMSGIHALVRLLIEQKRRDEEAGLRTGGFVSGYRGSPLAGLDQALWSAREHLEARDIHFLPGINEELAATAVWGTQQLDAVPNPRVQGVFSLWYGKSPGVDRCGDVFKHANMAGTTRHGGMLVCAGDDHACKSSTMPNQSDYALIDALIPVLAPANLTELIELGLHGWAMSRFSGTLVGLKILADVVDSSGRVRLGGNEPKILLPEFDMPPAGLNARWPDSPLLQEERYYHHKLPAILAYARVNRIDRMVWHVPAARFGIIASGRAYTETREALELLGIDAARAVELGIRLFHVRMPWPLEPHGVARFAAGLDDILVVEEKRGLVEGQVKEHLFAERGRLSVVGKRDESGRPLLPEIRDVSALQVARVIGARLLKRRHDAALADRLAILDGIAGAPKAEIGVARTPYFCSGCPHSTSTKLPDGSLAAGGIGCHLMASWMDRGIVSFTQMGGEGVNWIGQAPFTETPHLFANLGDGTYFHSGMLAIRQAIAAKVNLTYKILYNDAVSMTGGQPLDGTLSVAQLTRQLAAEGVSPIILVSDDPDKHLDRSDFAPDVPVRHRDDLDAVQRELRDRPGVSAIVYEQTCAAEKRRRRKRGTYPDPAKRVVINDLVCEGCGDCSVKSNCLSVVPLDTEFGAKRRIDQSSCNKDFSCLGGFCPSFVTVEGGQLRKSAGRAADTAVPAVPDPAPSRTHDRGDYNILIAGIGGTGVVTIGAMLGMAAHLDGRDCSVLDMTGLAQKGGSVLTHIRLMAGAGAERSARIPMGSADLMIACEALVAASPEATGTLHRSRTRVVANDAEVITSAFLRDPAGRLPLRRLAAHLRGGASEVDMLPAERIATALLGDSIGTNLLLVGYAFQKGWIPLSIASIERAIALNGIQVDLNLRAFQWGRALANDPAAIDALLEPATAKSLPLSGSLDEVISCRVAFLTDYQNAAYAARYEGVVSKVRAAEAAAVPGSTRLAEAVARALFGLMAYKDEYEVARLHSETGFQERIAEQFEGDYRLHYHLAPPLLARRDPGTGHPRKIAFDGRWMHPAFRLLARLRFLRGRIVDPFGWTSERRTERRLIEDYCQLLDRILAGLEPSNHAGAVALARLPETIRGYGHIKLANLERAKREEKRLLAEFANPVNLAPREAA
jgi:indolepyruvate ferredoxin oxidoreductase